MENLEFQKVILSSQKQFMAKYKAMKAVFEKHRGGGIKFSDVVDGKIFQIPGFNFIEFCQQNRIFRVLNDVFIRDVTFSLYPCIWK